MEGRGLPVLCLELSVPRALLEDEDIHFNIMNKSEAKRKDRL